MFYLYNHRSGLFHVSVFIAIHSFSPDFIPAEAEVETAKTYGNKENSRVEFHVIQLIIF
jgi:hypothetical protein